MLVQCEYLILQKLGVLADVELMQQDLYSYDVEQAMGHSVNNILTVLQKEKKVDLQGAADLVAVHCKELYDSFEADKQNMPSFNAAMNEAVS